MTRIILQRVISRITDVWIVLNDINASNAITFILETQSHESYINKAYMFDLFKMI